MSRAHLGAYVVESEARDADGKLRGTFRFYCATEERAREVAAQEPGRTWRKNTDAAA